MEVTNQFEQIDDYLSGRMGVDETAAFEKEMTTNSDLNQEVSFQKCERDSVGLPD